MDLNEYQALASGTAVYPTLTLKVTPLSILYPVLGLCGETGEVAENVKRIIRDDDGTITAERAEKLVTELGDALWYLSQVATELGVPLNTVAEKNIEKLSARQNRNKIHGEGDKR